MQCPKCQHKNREGAKFCEECGTKLPSICPKCGSEVRPQARFCDECGASLIPSPSPPLSPSLGRGTGGEGTIPKLENMHAQLQSLIPDALAQKYLAAEQQATTENRLTTALFADISGFTALSATRSPETMFQIVQDCFKQLVSVVANYEGSISGFRGDGMLALFGAPILHENDAERAVLTALDMREAMKNQQLQITIGVNTAMMTVGEIQTQLHREYTAYGSDINLAKRLQEAAKPGQILVGAGTYRLIQRAFDFEVLPELHPKGFPQPVTAYAVLGVKVHPEKLRGIDGLRARMIGREREFDELITSAETWLEGKGQIVSIIGEAGIGKSRLVTELKAYLERLKEGNEWRNGRMEGWKEDATQPSNLPSFHLRWLEGRCVSIGQPISYWPFLDILRSWFELSAEDSEAEVAQKVRQHVSELLPAQSDDILPFLGCLMNLRFGGELDTRLAHYSPEQIRHQTMMRLRDLFLTLSQRQRLMLVLEDLHWADDLSLDLVSLLMDELVRYPLMLVCVYRPEREHRVYQLSSMAQRKCLERYTEIMLQKLPPRESRRLVEELLAIDNLPESVRLMILRKSEGNPFFIKEVIRSLIERGLVYRENDRWKAREEVVELEVPDTIQSVILARVDRLEAEAKYVLQCASVIGRLFKHRLLEHLTQKQRELDRYITEFEERELVYEERTVPELEYAFKHALTQEATYQGILEQRRRTFHRQVAEGIERLYRERIEEYYEELAYHWERSGEREKTLEYLVKAGQKAAKQYANEVAIGYYTRAIELAKKMGVSGDRMAEIYEARGSVYSIMYFYEETMEDFSEAAKLYTNGTKRANMFQAIAGTYYWTLYERDDSAVKYARMAIEEVEPTDKSRDASLAYEGAANIIIAFDIQEGEGLMRKAIEISEEMGYKDFLAAQYTMLHWMYGYYYLRAGSDEIREKREEARKKALSYMEYLKPDLPGYTGTCMILGNTSEDEGEEYVYFHREALESGIKCGEGWAVVISSLQLGSVYRAQGDIQKAIEVYEQGWRFGVRARHIFGSWMVRLTNELMSLYISRGERSKLLEMMLQMVDSTLVLHRKPKVHPTVSRRWNDTVEETYKTLRTTSPEVYRELERSLESRLNEVDNNGERFFYHGQLMQLALLDGRKESAEVHAQELLKLRLSLPTPTPALPVNGEGAGEGRGGGSFAERISQKMKYAIELMSVQPEQRPKATENLLKQLNRFEDFQEVLEVINQVLSGEELHQALQAVVEPLVESFKVVESDFMALQPISQMLPSDILSMFYEKMELKNPDFALKGLQSASGSWFHLARALRFTEMYYGRSGRQDIFRQICRQFKNEQSEVLQKLGLTQLCLEPAQPSADYRRLDSVDTFDGDSLKPAWEWIDPRGDCAYEQLIPSPLLPSSSGRGARGEVGLQITVQPGHALNPDSHLNFYAPRLLQAISGDFAIETKVSDGGGGKKSGGLLVWKDEANYIRFEMPSSSIWEGEVHFEANVQGDYRIIGRGQIEANLLTFRLERQGSRFSAYCSVDGENWLTCGWVDIPMEDPIKVGFHALCPQSPATSSRFEYFKILRRDA